MFLVQEETPFKDKDGEPVFLFVSENKSVWFETRHGIFYDLTVDIILWSSFYLDKNSIGVV